MSLYKRKDSPNWWVKIHHSGGCLQQSTGTADEKAQEYHDKLKASLWEQEKAGCKAKYSWNEAVVRYLAETSHKASRMPTTSHICAGWIRSWTASNWSASIAIGWMRSARHARRKEHRTPRSTARWKWCERFAQGGTGLGLDHQSPAGSDAAGG